ncbi:MAG: hypothetical protein MK008_01655 [Bdellovibrionales bacterium]|nr:hypothetical protein [Bdellovibrionales bacterium]
MIVILFLLMAVVIALSGTKLSQISDRLADRTGIGEAVFGGVFLGAVTSISGTVLSVVSAYNGHTDLAIGNAVGGIAAQTFFLCIADILYRNSNLEHAAASKTNIMFGILLISLLAISLIPENLPELVFFGAHPVSFLIIVLYLLGLKYIKLAQKNPMWFPKNTKETKTDIPDEEKLNDKETYKLWISFVVLLVIMAFAGYSIEKFGVKLASQFGLSHYLLGTYFTAISTSLPELIISLAAVKRGALTMAVSTIVGGNTFDILFLSFSDFAYRDGSLFHVFTSDHKYLILLTIIMNTTLVLGLIRREKSGLANIGIETWVIGGLYIFGLLALI